MWNFHLLLIALICYTRLYNVNAWCIAASSNELRSVCLSPRFGAVGTKTASDEKPTVDQERRAYLWSQRTEQLLAFKSEYGHLRVPRRFTKDPGLGNWVNKQRQHYRNFLAGTKPCSLTQRRIDILNEIGFCWDASSCKQVTSSFSTDNGHCDDNEEEQQRITNDWWNHFQKLDDLVCQKKREDGNDKQIVLAELASTNSSLRKWLQQQRQSLRVQGNDKYGDSQQQVLNKEQLQALEKLDSNWWMTLREWHWELRYQELREYAKIHGDCCVPISYWNKQLAHFVSNQRKQYNLKMNREPSNLTEYRLKRLNAIGFAWNRWEYEFAKKQDIWRD